MLVLTKSEIFDLLSDNLAMLEVDDKSGKINWANKSLEKMFGYQVPGSLEGEVVEILVPDDLRDRHASLHRPSFSANPDARVMGRNVLSVKGKHRDGHSFPVAIMLLPRAANRLRVVVGLVFDMTGRETKSEKSLESVSLAGP